MSLLVSWGVTVIVRVTGAAVVPPNMDWLFTSSRTPRVMSPSGTMRGHAYARTVSALTLPASEPRQTASSGFSCVGSVAGGSCDAQPAPSVTDALGGDAFQLGTLPSTENGFASRESPRQWKYTVRCENRGWMP